MTPTTHTDTWPCGDTCETCYPLTGAPDLEQAALDSLVETGVDGAHDAIVGLPDERQVAALAAIIRKVDGDHSLGAAGLAQAILHEWKLTGTGV